MPKVLVVDDNALMRKQVATLFQETFKYEICGQAKDGVEAVEMYESLKPDLVTLDMTMPRKGGMEALEEIIQKDPDAKVIIVSAVADASMVTQALQKGACGYITKPLKIKDPEFIQKVSDELKEAMGV